MLFWKTKDLWESKISIYRLITLFRNNIPLIPRIKQKILIILNPQLSNIPSSKLNNHFESFLNKSLVHNFDKILKINASYLSFMRDMLSFCCIKLFWFYIANAWDVFISFPIKSCKLCYLFPFFTAQSKIITKFGFDRIALIIYSERLSSLIIFYLLYLSQTCAYSVRPYSKLEQKYQWIINYSYNYIFF